MSMAVMYAAFGRADIADGDAANAAAKAVEALLAEHSREFSDEETAELKKLAVRLQETARFYWSSPYAMNA